MSLAEHVFGNMSQTSCNFQSGRILIKHCLVVEVVDATFRAGWFVTHVVDATFRAVVDATFCSILIKHCLVVEALLSMQPSELILLVMHCC